MNHIYEKFTKELEVKSMALYCGEARIAEAKKLSEIGIKDNDSICQRKINLGEVGHPNFNPEGID